MIEALSLPFMQRALICGVLVAILCGWFGVFVVQRRLSFLGSGLAHAAFGGVALGIFLSLPPLVVAVPFTVVVGLAIVWVQQRTELAADTAIGVFFAVSMALGIVFLSRTDRYTTDAFAYLFGTILAIKQADLYVTLAVTGLALLTCPLWSRWAYATFDRELAAADQVNVQRDDYLLALCLAITIVISIKVVGIVLIAAFLVIPAATARLLTRRFSAMTIVSISVGVLSVLAGLLASYQLDLPSGPAIILVQATLFALSFLIRRR